MNLPRNRQGLHQSERHQLFIEIQNLCPLCDTQLSIHICYQPDAKSLMEQMECPQCGIKKKPQTHMVH